MWLSQVGLQLVSGDSLEQPENSIGPYVIFLPKKREQYRRTEIIVFYLDLVLSNSMPPFLFVLSHDKQIVPAKCKHEVLPTKIEIRLAKAEAIHWTSLQFSKENTVPQSTNVSSGRLTCLYKVVMSTSVLQLKLWQE